MGLEMVVNRSVVCEGQAARCRTSYEHEPIVGLLLVNTVVFLQDAADVRPGRFAALVTILPCRRPARARGLDFHAINRVICH